MKGGDELSLKDITFLRAIRDINGSPERYASTDEGVRPATVTAITEATTLTEEEVAYRLDHPRLGKSGLVTVYEAGPPGTDSAALNSAELTEAGEAAIAEAEKRQASVDAQEWQPREQQSEFDGMQEWEPAEVESDGTGVPTPDASTDDAGSPTDPATDPSTDGPDSLGTDRLAALEARVEALETETTADADQSPEPVDPERVESLYEEVAALRETTERLEATLEDAVSGIETIQSAEYGALDEKREKQLRTAVKSMVAFHQLAKHVLDVRVENFEPAAGRPDDERVEITRNRIGDALGVGRSGDTGGMTLSGGDSEWPTPTEAAGGRVFDGGESDDGAEDSGAADGQTEPPEAESEAPESGVYPPIGGSDEEDESPRNVADDAEEESKTDTSESETDSDASESETESDAPESGIYPPIGSSENADESEEADTTAVSDDDSESEDPVSSDDAVADTLAVDVPEEAETENIRETAAAEGHVMEPIRTTEGRAAPLPAVSPAEALAVRETITDANSAGSGGASEKTPVAATLDADSLRSVWQAVADADHGREEREAYARIVGEEPPADSLSVDHPDVTGLPGPGSADDDPAVTLADGEGDPNETDGDTRVGTEEETNDGTGPEGMTDTPETDAGGVDTDADSVAVDD